MRNNTWYEFFILFFRILFVEDAVGGITETGAEEEVGGSVALFTIKTKQSVRNVGSKRYRMSLRSVCFIKVFTSKSNTCSIIR